MNVPTIRLSSSRSLSTFVWSHAERELSGPADRVKVVPQHLLMSRTMQLAPVVSRIGNHLRSPSPDHRDH